MSVISLDLILEWLNVLKMTFVWFQNVSIWWITSLDIITECPYINDLHLYVNSIFLHIISECLDLMNYPPWYNIRMSIYNFRMSRCVNYLPWSVSFREVSYSCLVFPGRNHVILAKNWCCTPTLSKNRRNKTFKGV